VGTATLAVAEAFNGMAIDVGAGSWVGGIFAVVIIFMGHTLNILLAAMGVLVHGIRLNTLEFAGHLGLQWTGIRYLPFTQKSGRSPLLVDKKTSDMKEKPE
jgi:V/A-type H+/Na+-transporting ATPase subunit I